MIDTKRISMNGSDDTKDLEEKLEEMLNEINDPRPKGAEGSGESKDQEEDADTKNFLQEEAPYAIKIQILAQELESWRNSKFILDVRYRINKSIENKELMEQCKKELENAEAALTEIRARFKEEKRLENKRIEREKKEAERKKNDT